MRQIKFRAWDVLYDKMLYSKEGNLNGFFHTVEQRPQDQAPVMQFTGIKDKYGFEIWEGDVVLVYDEDVVPVTDEGQGPIEECNHLVVVEMRNGVWGFEIPATDDGETGWYGLRYWNEEISSEGYAVVGNIYENPELL
jgi:uncharacterized phage protein (TIGR01671 family)